MLNPFHSVVVDKVTSNIYHANTGEGLPFHSHTFDHVTMCVAGSCKVTKKDKVVTLDKSSRPVLLKAPDEHQIEALQDGTVFINIFGENK